MGMSGVATVLGPSDSGGYRLQEQYHLASHRRLKDLPTLDARKAVI